MLSAGALSPAARADIGPFNAPRDAKFSNRLLGRAYEDTSLRGATRRKKQLREAKKRIKEKEKRLADLRQQEATRGQLNAAPAASTAAMNECDEAAESCGAASGAAHETAQEARAVDVAEKWCSDVTRLCEGQFDI